MKAGPAIRCSLISLTTFSSASNVFTFLAASRFPHVLQNELLRNLPINRAPPQSVVLIAAQWIKSPKMAQGRRKDELRFELRDEEEEEEREIKFRESRRFPSSIEKIRDTSGFLFTRIEGMSKWNTEDHTEGCTNCRHTEATLRRPFAPPDRIPVLVDSHGCRTYRKVGSPDIQAMSTFPPDRPLTDDSGRNSLHGIRQPFDRIHRPSYLTFLCVERKLIAINLLLLRTISKNQSARFIDPFYLC